MVRLASHLLTLPTTAPSAGRRPGLTRDQVLTAALAIIDEGGVEELTMRRLGKALDRNPMAIYRHAKDKDALLDGVVETVVADFVVTRQTGNGAPVDWEWALRDTAHIPPGRPHPPESCACPGHPIAVGAVGAPTPGNAQTP